VFLNWTQGSDYSSTGIELLPLPLTRRITEVVRSAIGANGIGNLLPLHFCKALVITQRVVMVLVNAIEIMHNKLGQKVNLHPLAWVQ
jgi:hypothetical protein